jgi:hypothetical protein
MNRRTALKIILASIVAPKAIFDTVISIPKVITPEIPETILQGFKGGSFFTSGYIYAPYIPIIIVKPLSIVDNIVSVQPMAEPNGIVYYLNPVIKHTSRLKNSINRLKRVFDNLFITT